MDNVSKMDIIGALERLRDEIAWTDPEDFEDNQSDFVGQLESVIDVLYHSGTGGATDE